jgi:subtilisin family serine protease
MGDASVKIAILDEGITNHPDFPIGVLIDTIDYIGANRDYPIMDSNCVPCDSCGHGFAVTSLLIAEHNDSGIAGLVPNCKAIFVKIANDAGLWPRKDRYLGEAMILAAQHGANIMSNSWGCDFCTITDEFKDMINLVTTPRPSGYGVAVFFAAGNSGYQWVAYPARMPSVIAVGATDSVDCRWAYTTSDSTLDVMATSGNIPHWVVWPSGYAALGSIMTADRPGGLGYNSYYYQPPYVPWCNMNFTDPELVDVGVDYFCSFGGTSAACPQVAGIAAMIMSRRPDLKDSNFVVYNIIERSSEDQVGPSTGNTPDLPGKDNYYGWGRVSAFRALLAVSRGDVNNDKLLNIQDITYLINYLYKGGTAPVPDTRMADSDCNGIINLKDIQYLTKYLYYNGPAPKICFEY